MASIYLKKQNYPTAVSHYQSSIELAKKFGEVEVQCTALRSLNKALYENGSFSIALLHLKQEQELTSKHVHLYDSSTLSMFGKVYSKIGDFQQAIEYHKHYLKECQKQNKLLNSAQALGDIANCYKLFNQLEEAIENYLDQQAIMNLIPQHFSLRERAALYNNLGSAYRLIGNLTEAEVMQRKNMELCKQDSDTAALSRAYDNLGLVYFSMQHYAEALDSLKAGLNLCDSNDLETRAHSLYLIGAVLWKQKSYESALHVLVQSIDLFSQVFETLKHRESKLAYQSKFDLAFSIIVNVLVTMNDEKKALEYAEMARTKSLCSTIQPISYVKMQDLSVVLKST